ncbi:MAG: cytochrome c [Pseudomonadales bacterium]|nr:cytochrome c [Pseudomonadales bacterium]
MKNESANERYDFNMKSQRVSALKKIILILWFSLLPVRSIASDSFEALRFSDGIYNKAQAKSGKKLYKKHCLSCHEKGYFEPVFLAWQGESAGMLYEVMSAAMPESSPGSLDPDEYADIFAYVLKEIGFPASTEPLDPDSEAFSKIIIRPPG